MYTDSLIPCLFDPLRDDRLVLLITPPAFQGKSDTQCDCLDTIETLSRTWISVRLELLEDKTWDLFTADYTRHYQDTH